MSNRGNEFKAGIFVLLGAVLIGGMVIYFSQLREQFTPRYSLKVMFPNASGLIEGSLVYMAGVKVGRVDGPPKVIQDDMGVRVEVPVAIDENVKIRSDAKWTIGASGLLGDRYVEVKPVTGSNRPPLKSGMTVKGDKPPDIQEIAEKLEPLIEQARSVAGNLQQITAKINDRLLTEENSEEITEILIGAEDLLRNLNTVMEEGKFEVMAADLRSTLGNVEKLFDKAGSGVGPLYEIMADKETGDNLAAFIANLRTHGILFYSDTYKPGDDTGKNAPKKEVEASAVKTPQELRR
ncbi:MAG: MlaD family protein [Verrucomicrobiota bacterium]